MEKILLWPDPEEKSVRPGPAPSPLRSSPEQGASVPQAPHAPADATLGAVVLLLVAVEEVADPAVVLAEEVVAPLAALLDLPSHGEDEEEPGRGSLAARLALPNMAPPPPTWRCTLPQRTHLLHEAAAGALHLGHAEAV